MMSSSPGRRHGTGNCAMSSLDSRLHLSLTLPTIAGWALVALPAAPEAAGQPELLPLPYRFH